MYSVKTLLDQPLRFVLTVAGVALCVILMLFLLSVYQGVAEGSVEYVRTCDADLWVLQLHATNILRSTSILTGRYADVLTNTPGIESVSPILFILASVKMSERSASLYITGFEPGSGRGGPPAVVKGSTVGADSEIVIDRSFAAKYNIGIGDQLPIKDDTLTVVGLSTGTNMFVIQYAFVSLQKAQEIYGLPDIVSCYQVKTKAGAGIQEIIGRIEARLPDIAVYDSETFLKNNIQEMESGFLPLLFVVAIIGAVVLTAILSLILSVNVLERRKDYAIMKALGSPTGFIPMLVVQQALLLAGTGMIIAIIIFFPLVRIVEVLAPEVAAISSFRQIVTVAVGVGIISLVSSIIPNRRLHHIYPLEVFR